MNIHCYNHYLHSAGFCASWLPKVGKVAGPNVALTPVGVGRCVLPVQTLYWRQFVWDGACCRSKRCTDASWCGPVRAHRIALAFIAPNSHRHGHTLPRCLVSCIHHLPLFFSASWRYWSSIFEYIQKKSRTCAHILAAAKPSLRSLVLSLSLSPFALSSLSSVPSQSLHVLCPFAFLSDHLLLFFYMFQKLLWMWLRIVWPIWFTNTIM